MTPYQLRQLADRKRVEADALTASASRLRTLADTFRDLLEGIPDRSRRVWQGPAAADFEDEARAADCDLRQQAQILSSTATGFEREAADLKAEARAAEERATAEEAATAAGGQPPPPTSVW